MLLTKTGRSIHSLSLTQYFDSFEWEGSPAQSTVLTTAETYERGRRATDHKVNYYKKNKKTNLSKKLI